MSEVKQIKPKVVEEVAENEFDRWAESMDLDLDTAYMDSEEVTSFEKIRRRLVDAIKKGSLIINDNGEAVYTPHRPDSKNKGALTFHERTGAAVMAMDGKKKNSDVEKMYAVMANMCKVHRNVFAGLAGTDSKICENIFQLLMD